MVAWQAWRRHKRGVGRRGAGRRGVGRRGAARWALRRTRRTWVGLRVGGVTVMVTARCPGWVPAEPVQWGVKVAADRTNFAKRGSSSPPPIDPPRVVKKPVSLWIRDTHYE
eukprot:scaffold16108_cov61-Phaeocystis_antarctica.AAC.5